MRRIQYAVHLLMLFVWVTPLQAQSSFPFPVDSAQWHVDRVTPIIGPFDGHDLWMYWVNGDSLVVDNIVYTAVYARGTCHSDPSTSYQYQPYTPAQYARIGGLRQEGDSIFFRRLANPFFKGAPSTLFSYPVDQEVLLYDFSLTVGDTIAYVTPDRIFVVESVSINSQGRKEIELSSFGCGYPINVTWREGQGCTQGLLETICFYFYAGSCFSSEATGEPPCSLPCTPDDPVLVATDDPGTDALMTLFPNPSSGLVTLRTGLQEWPLLLIARDLLGRVVHHQTLTQSSAVLDLDHIPSGPLLITVTGRNGERWSSLLSLVR